MGSVLGCASSSSELVLSWKDGSLCAKSRLTFGEMLGLCDTVGRNLYSHGCNIYLNVGLSASLYPASVMIWRYDR